jgi:hypothetical protein
MTIRRSVARFAVALGANLFLAACGAQREVPEYRAFAAPERVTIRGYGDSWKRRRCRAMGGRCTTTSAPASGLSSCA